MNEKFKKQQFLHQLSENDKIDSIFFVSEKQLAKDKNNKSYLTLTLQDKSGRVSARIFQNADDLDSLFNCYDFIHAKGSLLNYKNEKQIHLQTVTPVPSESLSVEDFFPSTSKDKEQTFSDLKHILGSIEDHEIKNLVEAFLFDEELMFLFKNAPAAKTIHHAYLGGLLEHTLSVIQLADMMSKHYLKLKRDDLLVGAFLHDIGKTKELEFSQSFQYTDEGRLVGHIVMTAQWIAEKGKTANVSKKVLNRVTHLVLAHHGKLEFGSPKRPKTIEALIISMLDELDSRVWHWQNIIESSQGVSWTSYLKDYDRYLYFDHYDWKKTTEAK